MRKEITLYLLLLLIINGLYADKIGVIKDVLQPEMIQVDGNELYILEGGTIFKYSLKNLKLINKFGKKGEGPGELQITPFFPNMITVFPDYIFAESLSKVMFFTKKGLLIKEYKTPFRKIKILPVKDKFVVKAFSFSTKDKMMNISIKLFDKNFKELIELYKQKFPLQPDKAPNVIPLIPDSVNFCIYNNKIFIEDSISDFRIHVFNSNGKKLYTINKDFNKIKTTKQHKEIAIKSLKKSFLQKEVNFFVPSTITESGWGNFKKWAKFIFPEYIPSIQNLIINDEKIYINTFSNKEERTEYLIMDLKGRIIDKKYFFNIKKPTFVAKLLGQGINFFAIDNGQLIYLKENEDDETWELHIEKIN